MWKRAIVISALLCLQAGCTAVSQESERSDYKPISLDRVENTYNLTEETQPQDFALQLMEQNLNQSREGRQSETYKIEYPEAGKAVITVEIVGLADDSVRGMRDRYVMEYNQTWELVWAGSQFTCYRGHQDWSAELCP
ncbi:hypothetical protein PN462_22825 [Spirulina sp. CS-785/01]|uniref:hypothetical protein n=1 Tax=Spirulina sp. CS-785/01 TaxID=3021716 RepID=UPI00232DB975|nr:hypothetical protein [Spirulina sp. CS-785/01]MDB9315964.1 hypothetical protein [Spirulina sp. CS-785/01]